MVYLTDSLAAALLSVLDGIKVHPYFVSAELHPAKLDGLRAKYESRYPDLLRDRFFALRLRKSGKTSHRLIIYKPKDESTEGFFVLQASTQDDKTEPWKNALERHQRITLYGYEAVCLPRLGQPSAWTWRIEKDRYKRDLSKMIDAIDKKKDKWLEQWVKKAAYWPGFVGVRLQVSALQKAFYGRFFRIRGEAPPEWWPQKRRFYVTRRVFKRRRPVKGSVE